MKFPSSPPPSSSSRHSILNRVVSTPRQPLTAQSRSTSSYTLLAMSTKDSYKPMGPLDPQYVTKVYIPSALLIVAVAYVKANWTPFAVAAAALLAGLQFYGNRECL